jgi:hypothetical protein
VVDRGNPAEAGLHGTDEGRPPQRAIIGFHQDDERHWVAELECGHTQHMRHDPPWQNREWVLTPEGRARFIGVRIECRRCSQD